MNGLLIDNFAGGGGASTGIEAALGRSVDIAVNHDADALAMHAANHPRTMHLQEDVFAVNPREVCGGRAVDVAWFSPDCTHHAKAKGGKPVTTKRRGLAWVALRWAYEVRPEAIILENVEEFKDWGPLDATGRPIKTLKGRTFRSFLDALGPRGLSPDSADLPEIREALGDAIPHAFTRVGLAYNVECRELIAADYGARTWRKRLFVIARANGSKIVWPEKSCDRWLSMASALDMSLPMRRVEGLCARTRAKIDKGLALHSEPFVISYYGTGASTYQIHQCPLPTVTTRDRFALISRDADGPLFRMLSPRELARAQGFPDSYVLPGTKTSQVARIGNSVCPPVAEALVRANCPWAAAQEVAA